MNSTQKEIAARPRDLSDASLIVDDKRTIPSLDGLRAIAIGLVILNHLDFLDDEAGYLGVRLFFVISGFLITTLLGAEMHKTGQVSLKRFYFRRSLRIFPACYAMIGVVFLVSRLGYLETQPGDILHALTYTTNLKKVWIVPQSLWLGPTWSLSVEEQFYLAWPALLAFFGWRRALTGAVVSILLYNAACFLFSGRLFPQLVLHQAAWPPFSFDGIAMGCVLAGARGWLGDRHWYRRFQRSWFFWLIILIPALKLVHRYVAWSSHRPFRSLIHPLFVDICLALLVDWCIVQHRSIPGAILNWRPVATIGVLSYSLYLWQLVVFTGQSAAIKLAEMFAVAIGSYLLIERPFLKLRRTLEPKVFGTARMVSVD